MRKDICVSWLLLHQTFKHDFTIRKYKRIEIISISKLLPWSNLATRVTFILEALGIQFSLLTKSRYISNEKII